MYFRTIASSSTKLQMKVLIRLQINKNLENQDGHIDKFHSITCATDQLHYPGAYIRPHCLSSSTQPFPLNTQHRSYFTKLSSTLFFLLNYPHFKFHKIIFHAFFLLISPHFSNSIPIFIGLKTNLPISFSFQISSK